MNNFVAFFDFLGGSFGAIDDSFAASLEAGSPLLTSRYFNNPNDTYKPSELVKYGHMLSGSDFFNTATGNKVAFTIPNQQFRPRSNDNPYLTNVLFLPLSLLIVGILVLLITLIILMCKCCFKCCRANIPDIDDPDIPNELARSLKRKRFIATIFIIILCILVVAADMIIYLGNDSINNGVTGFISIINDILNIIKNLGFSGTNMQNSGESVRASTKLA